MKTIVLTALIALGAAAPSFAMDGPDRTVISNGDAVHSDTANKIFDRLAAESAQDE